jgi:nucleoside-diphosphate-sugar epimerase
MAMFDCYVGKRVLVTGHTGFKGTWQFSDRAKRELGWENQLSVMAAIEWTIEWEKKSLVNPLDTLDAQIYQHMDEKK